MSGLMSQGAILTASRMSNFAILMLSPLLLVRILEVDDYGRYQEFMIYATLFVTVCGFRIDASLTYFLPRYPQHSREFVSQNAALILASSVLFLTFFYLARNQFLEVASYDFVAPLIAYVFFFTNLNSLEYYWIANKRTDLVLYYSACRLLLRVSVLLIAAILTRDVETILWALVGAEVFRLMVVLTYLLRAGLLTFKSDLSRVREQVRFTLPVGLAGLMQQAGRNIGKLFVGSVLGPAALALYAVASYLLPMVLVIRGSIADVIFPEMVKERKNPERALQLWQRSNIVFCVLLFPPFVLLFHYAELFITTLFTSDYLSAVPIFQVYAFWLLRRCFNMDVLLRTRGKTGFMLTGTGLSVLVNIALMILLYDWFGLIGPAVAYIAAEILLEIYYAILVKREFKLSLSALIDWRGICRVGAGCLIAIPILVVAEYLPGPDLMLAMAASITFVTLSWFAAYRLGISDIGRIAAFLMSLFRRSETKPPSNADNP